MQALPVVQDAADNCTESAAERAVLDALFLSTRGPSWTNAVGWNTSAPICSRSGVTCSACRVTALRLDSNGLAGALPELPWALSALQTLDVSDNADLSGTLPAGLALSTQMNWFDCSSTAVSGSLPAALAAWTQTKYFGVEDSSISSTLPASYAAWSQVTTVAFGSTQISGSLSPAFAAWTQLQTLDTTDTQVRADGAGRIHLLIGTV
jgi:hypothetical protein